MFRSLVLAVGLLAVPAVAQTRSLIVSPAVAFKLKNGVAPQSLGVAVKQESIIVTPSAASPYAARPFRTITTLNVMHGDGDGDGKLAILDRYGDLQNVMTRRRPPHVESGPFEPGAMWMSHGRDTAAVATTTGIVQVRDGDVYRCRNGRLEFFVKETTLAAAFATGGGNFDIDGIVQDVFGNLSFTFADAVTTIGRVTYLDGDLLHVPASAITYDAAGSITAIAPKSVQVFARESDFSAMVANSRAVDANGARITALANLAALDVDPNGGFWFSPRNPNLLVPHLIFASSTSAHLDNIWSTRSKGTLAVINGKTMGYTTGRADGSVLGIDLIPNQGAINALAVVPAQQDWIAMDSLNAGLTVSGQFGIEIGRVAPRSPVALFVSAWNGDRPGGWVRALPLGAGLGGNRWLELDPITIVPLVTVSADARGYAAFRIRAPSTVPPGVDVLVQGVGTPFGSSVLSLSATSNWTF